MLVAKSTQVETDKEVFNKTQMLIARYMEAAMDSRIKGNNHLCFVNEVMAEGVYKLWIEMTSPDGYGKYSKILLAALERELNK